MANSGEWEESTPFVAEVAVDLEDPLDSADHDPLEVQLRRDPQVQVHVHGIHMGDERPRGRSAVQHLQHRRFDLEIAAIVQRRAQRAIDRAPHLHRPAGLRSDDQIHIALPNPALLGERFVRDRQWPQRLGGDRPGIGQHRQLAAPRGDDLAVHEQVVAEIHVGLECGQRFRADAGQRHHHLQFGAGVAGAALAQRGETQLPGVAQEDDPAGDADHFAGVGIRRQIGKGLP